MTEIHLSEEDRRFVEQQVEAGAYKDPNDVIYAGLRMLAEADVQSERGEYLPFTSAEAHPDSIIERGMQLLDRKS